jgi:hypothetical protein
VSKKVRKDSSSKISEENFEINEVVFRLGKSPLSRSLLRVGGQKSHKMESDKVVIQYNIVQRHTIL